MYMIAKIYEHFKRKYRYVSFLKEKGISIGNNVNISPQFSVVDFFAPFLISIGNNVYISSGVSILTHDYARFVISHKNGRLYGGGAPVKIGNNVYVGSNSMILKGTVIEDNVIVGAGSITHGTLESGNVYAGCPARKICSIDEYEIKISDRQINEAFNFAFKYYQTMKDLPPERIFEPYDYQWLWSDITISNRFKVDPATINNPFAKLAMKNKKRPFKNYSQFIKDFIKKYDLPYK